MTKAILFDLDGTLLDTSEGIKHSVCYTLSRMGYSTLPEETLLRFVGPPIQDSLMLYCGVDSVEAQRGANIFRNFYKKKALFEANLYDGIIQILQCLRRKNIKIGVATYKREDYAIDLLEHFGIAEYCSVIHGADNDNKLTKADIINLCIQELGVGKTNTVLVGDTDYDAKGAAEANVSFVAVTYGFGYKRENFNCSYPYICSIDNPKALFEVINNNEID